MSMPIPLTALPQSPDGFYAINNQFLVNGPKGFTELKVLENEDMFVRMDLPGVPEEGVDVSFDSSKNVMIIYGDAPKIHTHDPSNRKYITMMTKLVCNCYLRGTDPHDPTLTGPELKPHPWVLRGSNLAYESKQLQNGSLYLRLDMPGVPKDNFTVSVNNGRVMVTGQAPAVSHDSGGRFYSGVVAMFSNPVDIPSRRIKTIAKNGVIRLLIPRI